jgi:ATP-dependent DNA helicase DinG
MSQSNETFLEKIKEVFSEDGALSRATTGYKERESQVEFALQVAQSLSDGTSLIAEAGTGTGKTFAYLVPSLLYGGRVLISTAGKTLQDQLFQKDVPALRKALGIPVSISILKGRANYVCKLRLDRARQESVAKTREELKELYDILKYEPSSKTGERSQFSTVRENSGIWKEVTSTNETCLGNKCDFYEDCYVYAARNKARSSDIVIVNHHLFLADLSLKEAGQSDLLSDFDLVVIDEAHQVPQIAETFFSQTLSLFDVKSAAQDALSVATRLDPVHTNDWNDLGKRVVNAADDVRLKFSLMDCPEEFRSSVAKFSHAHLIEEPLQVLVRAIDPFLSALETLNGKEEEEPELALAKTRLSDYLLLTRYWAEVFAGKAMVKTDPSPTVRWFTLTPRNVFFNETPLSFAEAFNRLREQQGKPWILTSATLSIRGDFSHFIEQMGLPDARLGRWESPFDYGKSGLLYIPTNVTLPNDPGFSKSVVEILWPLLKITQGRAFVLCTTLRAVSIIAAALREKIEAEDQPMTLFEQGDAPKNDLITRFRKSGNGILVGSMSFWEGVDIKGDALSLVAVDKVPFSPPDDPVFEGKKSYLQSQGKNAFTQLALPDAIMQLMQGVGRLIRSESDSGLVVICDKRLIDPACRWGKLVWQSLPPFARTKDAQAAQNFLHEKINKS